MVSIRPPLDLDPSVSASIKGRSLSGKRRSEAALRTARLRWEIGSRSLCRSEIEAIISGMLPLDRQPGYSLERVGRASFRRPERPSNSRRGRHAEGVF